MNKKKKSLIAAVVVVIIAVCGILIYNFNSGSKKVTDKDSKVSQKKDENTSGSTASKDNGKSSDKSSSTSASGSSSQGQGSSAQGKGQASGQSGTSSTYIAKHIEYKGEVKGYIKAATIGSWTQVKVTLSGKPDSSVAYFQIYDGSKPISRVMNISKGTTVYPVTEAGAGVTVRLFDKNQKYIGEKSIKYEKLD